MVKDSPLKNSKNQRSIRAKSMVLNEQLQLLYQIEQRKVVKLENENRALRERINNLLTKNDDERIELLAADKTRRKLAQLKAITERTIRSLDTGIAEFRAFVGDIDETLLEEEEINGAIEPAKANQIAGSIERPLREFKPTLKRIPESPMIPMASTSSTSTYRFSNEVSIVDESNIFDDESQQQQQLGDKLTAAETRMYQIEEEAKAEDEINEQLNGEEKKVETEDEEKDEAMDGKKSDEMEKMEEASKEEEKFASPADEKNIANEKTTAEQKDEQEQNQAQNQPSPKLSIVNETIWTTARMEEDEEEEEAKKEENANNERENNEEEGKENNQNKEEKEKKEDVDATPMMPSTVTIRRTTMRRTQQQKEEEEEVIMVTETPADEVDVDLTLTKVESTSQYSGTSTPFSTPHSCTSAASGRQRRTAATKIGNYKEPPLNKKMRRE